MRIFLRAAAGPLMLMLVSVCAFANNVKYIRTCQTNITQPGEYHLAADLTCPVGYAITISASEVELDLDGHTLDGATYGLAGVLISGASDVEIDGGGGTVENFATGILFTNCKDSSVSNVNALRSFPTSGPANGTGIMLQNCCNIKVSCNNIKGNFVQGILVLGDGGKKSTYNSISGNNVSVNAAGIVLSNATYNWIVCNIADNNKSEGIILLPGSFQNSIAYNQATGNMVKDLVDQNACNANSWFDNWFGTASSCIHHEFLDSPDFSIDERS